MAFLLFLFVFAITSNKGTARPMTENNIKIITRNGISNEEDENVKNLGEIFNIPTVVKPGFKITINGLLNATEKLFKAVMRGNTNKECKITYDFKSETIVTSDEDKLEQEEYNLLNQTPKTFELSMKARLYGVVSISLEINNLGQSSEMFCDFEDLRNIKYIEMQEGVSRTDRFVYSNSLYE